MKILSFGEALIDLLASKYQKEGELVTEAFIKYAGGAPANVAVAAAKQGIESYFVGKVGKDNFGDFLIESLNHFGVSTRYTNYSQIGKTALAFVSLDDLGERSFQFYDGNAAHNDFRLRDFDQISFDAPVIFNFCSGSLSKPHLKKVVDYGFEKLIKSNSIICFDINFRPAFWLNPKEASDIVLEIATQVNIIKASNEELIELFGIENTDLIIEQLLAAGVQLILITNGSEPISYYTKNYSGTYTAPKVDVVDTTAAGDAFVGGFLAQIALSNSSLKTFDSWILNFENILNSIDFASKCGAFTVSKFGAFAALPYKSDIA